MLRLRTSLGLSVAALLIGIAGTGWLSSLTAQWREPSDRVAMVRRTHAAPVNRSTARRGQRPPKVLPSHRIRRDHVIDDGATQTTASAAPATLQPLTTPADTSQTWDQLRGHLDGQLIVQVQVDAAGRVGSASVVASSGDPILDQHALRSVRGWRFVVPRAIPTASVASCRCASPRRVVRWECFEARSSRELRQYLYALYI